MKFLFVAVLACMACVTYGGLCGGSGEGFGLGLDQVANKIPLLKELLKKLRKVLCKDSEVKGTVEACFSAFNNPGEYHLDLNAFATCLTTKVPELFEDLKVYGDKSACYLLSKAYGSEKLSCKDLYREVLEQLGLCKKPKHDKDDKDDA